MKRALLALLYFATTFNAESQSLQFKTYSVNDGLVSRHVRRILQDTKGFLWIGTWEGLSKYDGARFLNFTPANGFPGNVVNDIYEDEAGRLLVAINEGSVLMIQADTIVHSPVFTDVVINQFSRLKKTLYAATDDKGIWRLSANKADQIKENSGNDYYFITSLDDSLLAAGGPYDFEIIRTNGQTVFSLEKPVVVNCCFLDAQKRIWIGADDGLRLLQFFADNPAQTKALPLPSSLDSEFSVNNAVNDLLMDHQENIWIATEKGLLCYRKDGTTSVYTNKNGLPASSIYCLYQDREKNIWIGTSQGLSRLITKNNYRQLTSNHGLLADDAINICAVSPTELLITSGGGLQLYDRVGNRFSTIKMGLPSTHIAANKGKALLYDDFSAAQWDLPTKTVKSFAVPQANCRDMDSRGWIYSSDGLGRIFVTADNKTYKDSLGPIRLNKLLADSHGYLWVGTWVNGLYRIRYSIEHGKLKTELRDFNNSFPSKQIRNLFEDKKGNIWVGTRYDGVYVLTKKDNEQYSIMHCGIAEGLASSWVTSTAEDDEGNIWIGTYGGLDKLIPVQTGFRVFNFSHINNVSSCINDIAVSGNTIWCASNEGLLHFTDDHLDTLSAPPLWITSCSVAGRLQNGVAFVRDTIFHLKPSENAMAFSFSAGSLLNEKIVLYSFRLLGMGDTAWSAPANVHSINYASLRPGHYRFEVRSFGLNGKPGTTRIVAFVIHPPFTQTPLFYGLCFVALVIIGFGLYSYRIRQLLRLQKVRSQIATDLHDEIGSSLTNIGLLSAIVEKNIDEKKDTKSFLFRIREDIKTSGQALDDIIWSVNITNDSTSEMLARMRRYAAEVFENAEMKYELIFPKNEMDMSMKMEQRRDIYLVFKEAVNNIVRHSAATAARVEVSIKDTTLCLMVSDNGKGFVKGVGNHRNGLMNMEKRAVKWDGTICIHSDKNQGTTVTAEIPLS